MQRRVRTSRALAVSVSLSMLAAISIVCGKYLAINLGEFMRFSLENLPIIFASVTFGVLPGVAVAVAADLLGCLMVGYAINPVVTLGAASIGLISGCVWCLFGKLKLSKGARLFFAVFFAHAIGSVLIKGAGLSVFYSIPYAALILWRLLNYIIVGTVDGAVVYILLKSRTVMDTVDKIKGRKEK